MMLSHAERHFVGLMGLATSVAEDFCREEATISFRGAKPNGENWGMWGTVIGVDVVGRRARLRPPSGHEFWVQLGAVRSWQYCHMDPQTNQLVMGKLTPGIEIDVDYHDMGEDDV